MFVGICKISLRLPHTGSLKGKRQIVKKVVERSKGRFNVAVAEVGSLDDWHRSEIGLVAVGNEGAFVNSLLDKVLDFIESLDLAEVVHVDMEIMSI